MTVAVVTGVVVPVGVTMLVPVAVAVEVAPGVSVGVNATVGVGDIPGTGVTLDVTVAAGVFVAVSVTVGVTGTVGDAAGSVGEGAGSIVAPGVGVLRSGPDVAVLEGTLLRPVLPVSSTRAVFPCAPVGLARQGLGGRVGVTTISVGVTAGGAVAVINTALLTAF